MYRILEEYGEVRERRNQRRHPNYTKPELLAHKRPTRFGRGILRSFVAPSWTYYYLYVILDIFKSNYVAWLDAGSPRKCRARDARLIGRLSVGKQDIEPDQLTLGVADRQQIDEEQARGSAPG